MVFKINKFLYKDYSGSRILGYINLSKLSSVRMVLLTCQDFVKKVGNLWLMV